MKVNKSFLKKLIRESMENDPGEWYEAGWNDAIVDGTPTSPPSHPQKCVDAYWDGYQDGLDHVAAQRTAGQYGLVEQADYDPLGDSGVPFSGGRHDYGYAFIDTNYGGRRVEFVIDMKDEELARDLMRKMRKQGEVSGVQRIRRRFDPREVTTRQELERMLKKSP